MSAWICGTCKKTLYAHKVPREQWATFTACAFCGTATCQDCMAELGGDDPRDQEEICFDCYEKRCERADVAAEEPRIGRAQ